MTPSTDHAQSAQLTWHIVKNGMYIGWLLWNECPKGSKVKIYRSASCTYHQQQVVLYDHRVMWTFYVWHYTPHRCPSQGDWRCTSPLYESLTSTHLWSILHAERTRDPSIASSAELGRTLWDNSQTRRCRLHCFTSRARKNSQASSVELGRTLKPHQ